jgi:hypothetical protein
MTKDELNAATTLDAARFYLDHHIKPVPVPRLGNHKGPAKPGWETHDYEPKDFVVNIGDDELNIGAKLGLEVAKDRFLFDVDIDMKLPDKLTTYPGAAEVVAELLPQVPWVFGRRSAARCHLMGLSSAPITTTKYAGLQQASLIEVRGLAKKKTPQITIVPPGVHYSQERLTFEKLDDLRFASPIDAVPLAQAVKHAAVALAILRVWPALGSRHDARLAFSKVLHEAQLPDSTCRAILIAVNRATGSNWADVAQCFQDTISKDPKKTLGAKWIIDHLLDDGQATLTIIDKILGRNAQAPDFNVTDIDLKTLTPAIWTRIDETNKPVRQCLQGGVPVRVVRLPDGDNPDQRRPTWVFQALELDKLRNEVAAQAVFSVKVRKGYKQVVPPSVLITDMLATEPTRIPLPVVSRIIYAPILAPDGTIQLEAGYQKATGTFYVPDPHLMVLPVAELPSPNDVQCAVRIIKGPLQDFPFETDSDRTHAVALFLLPFVRNLVDGPTPLYLIKKALAGEGATLLSDTLLFPAVGTDIAKLTSVDSNDEWRKTLTSTLLDGPAVVAIDNVRELVSPILASAITDRVWQQRILGVSRNAILPVECVWVATGINPVLHTELMRRIVPCTLNSGQERPWERSAFTIPDLPAWTRQHRGDMIWAALTLARSWYVAGRPKGDKSLGMFENWAHVVGGILKHAGFTGFLANLTTLYESADVEGDAVRWFYEQWNAQHQGDAVHIPEVALWALNANSPLHMLLTSKTDRGISTQFGLWVRSLMNTTSVPLPAAQPVDTEIPF